MLKFIFLAIIVYTIADKIIELKEEVWEEGTWFNHELQYALRDKISVYKYLYMNY